MTTAARIIVDAEFRDDETLLDALRIVEGVMGYVADNVVVHSTEMPTVEVPTHEMPAAVNVRVDDSNELGTLYAVTGDVNELLPFLSPHQLAVFRLSLPESLRLNVDSANYAIVPWVQRAFADVSLDPEHSCFWAYTPDVDEAQRLADAINNLEWAVPAEPTRDWPDQHNL